MIHLPAHTIPGQYLGNTRENQRQNDDSIPAISVLAMRDSSIHTVDISAEPISAYRPGVAARTRNLSAAIRQSLGTDVFLVFCVVICRIAV